MSDRVKNVLIGIFVIAAILASIYMILFLEPKIGDGKKVLQVRFTNISGIAIGTRVTLAGKPVGEVEKIFPIKDSRKQRTDELGRVYFYQLELRVDSSVVVYNTDEVAIATTGLLGEKSIAIIPKAPKKGVVPKDITNKIIYANAIEPLENVIYQISNLADTLENAVDDFDHWFVENQDDLSRAVESFADSMRQMDTLIDSANKEQLVSAIKDATERFEESMQLVKNALCEVENNEMIAKLDVILENFAEASEYVRSDGTRILQNVNEITEDIACGKGSLGKFIKNDDFYLRLVSIMGKIDTLMNDINHYGILFQYDKHWQRLRTKRANMLNALKTPKQFKRYFENEVDNVTTSLSRISILIDKAKEEEDRKKVMQSKCFQKDFLDLLRQVEHLLDSLKLYNEELVDTIDCK